MMMVSTIEVWRTISTILSSVMNILSDPSKHIESTTKLIALISVCLYATGFVVVNAYLSKHGSSDFSIVNAQFVFAGFLLSSYLFIWWYFIGFDILSTTEALEKYNVYAIEDRFFKNTFLIQITVVEIFYRVCFAAALFSSITFEEFDFYDTTVVILFATFGLFIWIDTTGFAKAPKTYTVFKIFLQIFTSVFFIIFSDMSILALAGSYYVLTLLYMLGFEVIFQKQLSAENLYKQIYLGFIVFGTIISFGLNIYDKIKAEYGGGFARNVQVLLKSPLPPELRCCGQAEVIKAIVIRATDRNVLIKTENKNVSLNSDQIRAIVFDEKPKKSPPNEKFRERFRDWGIIGSFISSAKTSN